MESKADINDIVYRMKSGGDSFAVATVVRTLSVTAAKPGAKAIINRDGVVVEGWIGGGCARSAVVKAAVKAIADGEPQFVSIHPDEVLAEQGIAPGEEIDGRLIASNMCPSKGSMDIFIEPFLANPELVVAGSSPVASAVCRLATLFDFTVIRIEGQSVSDSNDGSAGRLAIWQDLPVEHANRYIVIATQGAGDLQALSAALSIDSKHIGFVASQRKMSHLREKLEAKRFDAALLGRIKSPAGLDIGGVTPHEIALSILAELVQIRRSVNPANTSRLTHTN